MEAKVEIFGGAESVYFLLGVVNFADYYYRGFAAEQNAADVGH